MQEDLLKIINHYGVLTQLKYFYTEIYELTEAIIDFDNEYIPVNNAINHIAEEIADVMVMLKQFQYSYCIDDKYIEDMMNIKIDRQLDRIKGGDNVKN